MHGMIGRKVIASYGEGWEPYIPGLLRRREVIRQIGHKPTLYVMRKRDGWKWRYRACTPGELSYIETISNPQRMGRR
jgi:hypothetical protein